MRLKCAEYESGRVKVNLISDVTVSKEDIDFIKSSFEKELSGL